MVSCGGNPGEAQLDSEGRQTMRQLARNMAWMLKGIEKSQLPAPEVETEWQGMNFIR